MNFETAALLCDKFLLTTGEGNLFDELGLLLDAGDYNVGGTGNNLALQKAAARTLEVYDASLFADPSLTIFSEFEQLGLSEVMSSDIRTSLFLLAEGGLTDGEIEALLTKINTDSERMTKLSDEIAKLVAVADYFGVERRQELDADAVAVIQMTSLENAKAGHSTETMNRLIDQMQSFQVLVDFCEKKASHDTLANIRMISGDAPQLVADMSAAGASRLQKIVSEARHVQLAVGEIRDIGERLSDIGISDDFTNRLKEEGHLIQRFDSQRSEMIFKSFLNDDEMDQVKYMAGVLLSLMEAGAKIYSVVLTSDAQEGAVNKGIVKTDVTDAFDEPIPAINEASQDGLTGMLTDKSVEKDQITAIKEKGTPPVSPHKETVEEKLGLSFRSLWDTLARR